MNGQAIDLIKILLHNKNIYNSLYLCDTIEKVKGMNPDHQAC